MASISGVQRANVRRTDIMFVRRLSGKPTQCAPPERRPTARELAALFEFFAHRDQRSVLPMGDILAFAIESTRREAEITRLEWADLAADWFETPQ